MAHAERCLICYGKGTVPAGKYSTATEKKCHGCDGRGWVEVSDEPYYPSGWMPAPWPTVWPYRIEISPTTWCRE